MNCGSRAHGFSDLRPGVVFAHFAPIINGTPSSTHPAMKHIKQLLPRAQTPGLQQPGVQPGHVTKAGGTSAWSFDQSRVSQGELRNTWDPLLDCKVLPFWVKTSGSSFQTSKHLVDVVSRIWAVAFGMFEDVSLKMFQVLKM